MGYSIYFNSFDQNSADAKWDDFDAVVKQDLNIDGKIKELKEKLAEYGVDDREIYDPIYKAEFKEKIAQRQKMWEEIHRELEAAETKKEAGGIFYYIKNQEPIETGLVVSQMVELDLDFGGKMAAFSSAMYPLASIDATLRILFPELGIESMEDLEKESCLFLARHFDELRERYQAHKNELLKDGDIDVDSESELLWWMIDFKDSVVLLRSVCLDVAQKDGRFYVYSDGDGHPADEFLERRAKEHIERFKNHPLVKIPLQNYSK